MKKLPKVTANYGNLYRMLLAPIRAKLMLTAIELKVFNHLAEPTSADAIAQTLNTHPQNTRVFLDNLTAIDLVEKRVGFYHNSPQAQAFLVEDSPTYLGRILTFMKVDDQFLQNLPTLVKEGPPPPPEQSPFSEDALAKGVTLMADIERAGYAQEAVKIVSELPEFPSFQKMLDLGGGPGLIGMTIVDAHPTMKGVIFDLPPVVKATEAYIKEYEMEARVEVLGGDFNRTPIGEGYDLVFACSSLQFAQDLDGVVQKVYDALNPGGVFVSLFPFGHTHEGTKPEPIVLSLASMAFMGMEASFDQSYVAESMRRTGFKTIRSRTFETFMGPMELDVARK
jgi:SAM-dependent methyltransferase